MSKVEGSLWICRVGNADSLTGFCDVMVPQEDLEKHLWVDHRKRETTPEKVIGWFLLARGSDHGKPPRLGKAEDSTMELFGKGDFR